MCVYIWICMYVKLYIYLSNCRRYSKFFNEVNESKPSEHV